MTGDPAAAGPTFEVTTEYSCGCRDTWLMYNPPTDGAVHVLEVPCVPETCASCVANGMCETRRGMPPAYESADFADITPVRRTNYRRLSL